MSVTTTSIGQAAWYAPFRKYASFIVLSTVATLILTIIAFMVMALIANTSGTMRNFSGFGGGLLLMLIFGFIFFALPVIAFALCFWFPVWKLTQRTAERRGWSKLFGLIVGGVGISLLSSLPILIVPWVLDAYAGRNAGNWYIYPLLWFIWPISILVGPWVATRVYNND